MPDWGSAARSAGVIEGSRPPAAASLAPSASHKLDFLRSCAVLIVVASHLYFENPALAAFGRLGVLFFFLHTSLVLMFSLERQTWRTGDRRLFSTFMLRRFFRIYPLSMVAVLTIYLFRIPAYVAPNGHVVHINTDRLGLAANLFLVQDIVVSQHGLVSLLGVLWTLPLEMQMYLFLPLIFMFVRRVTDLRLLFLLWGGAALAARATPHVILRVFGGPVATFDWGWIVFPTLPEFAPFFLAGVLAFVLWNRTAPDLPFGTLPVLLGAIMLLYLGILANLGQGHTLTVFGMIACASTGLLLPSIEEPSSRVLRASCATIARYSYGIYLVHIPCIWLGFDLLRDRPAIVQWCVFVASLCTTVFVLYHAIERPFILVGAHLGRRWAESAKRVGPQFAASAVPTRRRMEH